MLKNWWNAVLGVLQQNRLTWLLLLLHALLGLVVLVLLRDFESGDHFTYMNLGKSLLQGKYSFWYWLDPWPPDTFRTPGYPLLVAAVYGLTGSVFAIKVLQYLLYLGLILLAVQVLRRAVGSEASLQVNVFLLLLLPQLQLPYYIGQVFPEILVMFLVMLWAWWRLHHGPDAPWWTWVVEGLILGFGMLTRPVLLLFPLAYTLGELLWCNQRLPRLKQNAVVVLAFLLAILPYGLWNHHHHGELRFTSLEGAEPNLQLGLWQHRLPGVFTHRYWPYTHFGYEYWAISLGLTDTSETDSFLAVYNAHYDQADSALAAHYTAVDSAMLAEFEHHKELFATYSTRAVQARRAVLREGFLEHISENPGWYLGTRLYNAVRMWVTGPFNLNLQDAGWKTTVLLWGSMLLTAAVFLLGVLLPLVLALLGRFPWRAYLPLWLMLLYYWGIHVPFAIQTRYTVPVRLFALMFMAILLVRWLGPPRATGKESPEAKVPNAGQ